MDELIKDISERNRQVDELEALMINNNKPGKCKIRNIFTKDMYAREMTIKADQWVTSKIHKTEFIFTVSKGKLAVSMNTGKELIIKAPFTGISQPYSRRVAYIIKDTIWTTYHVRLPNETEEEIEARIIIPHINELITDEMRERMMNIVHKKTELLT